MATSVTRAGPPSTTATSAKGLERARAWITAHRQAAGYLGAFVVIAAVLFVWNLLSARTAEVNAGRQLEQGSLALASKNYPLAASVLSQVVANYSGTHAADEASLLLAQVRLAQGQPQQAISVLERFAPKAGSAYQAQAYGLLGGAYENAGRPRDAARAYEQGATSAVYPFLRAQFLSDAGRAWVAAHDTARAITDYRTITQKLDSTSAAMEAAVRLGELTKGTAAAVGAP